MEQEGASSNELAASGERKRTTMISDYKFNDPENTACFVCDHVMHRQRPILYAAHFATDFYWQFTCGQNDHADENIKIISLKEATQICKLPQSSAI